MTIRPITINGKESLEEFNSCIMQEISVMEGGYIITPSGEIIVVKDTDQHHIVFSKYINSYLETKTSTLYNTFQATKILCELGCIVYSGIRLEYVKNKLENLDKSMASLTFPSDFRSLTKSQKDICIKLIESNKSLFSENERLTIQYGSLPDNVYTKEEVLANLTEELVNKQEKNEVIELETLKIELISYDNKEHLNYLKKIMQSKDIDYLWDLTNIKISNNQNLEKYIILNEEDNYIGYLNVSNPTEALYGNTVSLYYAIEENYRGKEYGKKIIREVSNWLFKEKNIDCIIAQVDTSNTHSIRTLIKADMLLVSSDDEYATFMQRKSR